MKNEILRAAEKASNGGALDKKIYDGEVIKAFGSAGNIIKFNYDVPISDLIALSCEELYIANSTSWRDSVQNLHCKGWSKKRDEIISYFESDLSNKSFPDPNSTGDLRFGFTGGAIYCQLGNHRAVAAKAWLAGHYGEKATFRQVGCYYRYIFDDLKKLMKECVEKGYVLKHSHVPTTGSKLIRKGIFHLILVKKNALHFNLYELDNIDNNLTLITNEIPIISALKLSLILIGSRLEFKEVPLEVIKAMLDESKIPQPAKNGT